MRMSDISPQANWILTITSEDGLIGNFDVKPYLSLEAFSALHDYNEFCKISNGRYFIEWDCGADLSADTIEALWQVKRHNDK